MLTKKLKEKIAGLDIGSHYAAAAQAVDDGNGGVHVIRHGYTSFAPGWDAVKRAAAVKKMWKKSRIQTSTVSTCFHSSALLIKSFKYSNLQLDELASTLLLEAEEAIQAPPEAICLDWWTHNAWQSHGTWINSSFAGVRSISGIMVAASKDRVQRHLDLLRLAGLYPVELDVRCLAGANLFHKMERKSVGTKTVHFSYISGTVADMAIIAPDGQMFPRSVNSRSGAWIDAPSYLAEHIREHLEFYEYKMQKHPVDELYVTGRAAMSQKLRESIQEETGLPVTLWNPFTDLKESDASHDSRQDSYGLRLISAIGLARRTHGDG